MKKRSLHSEQSEQFLQFTQLILPFSSATRLEAIVVSVWFVMAFSPIRKRA